MIETDEAAVLTKLPTEQELRLIKTASDFGLPPLAVSFGIRGDRSLIKIVKEYRKDPERFDTYLDLVAVDRAMRGDRKVWENLTHYERRHVLSRADEAPGWVVEQVWKVDHQSISRAKRAVGVTPAPKEPEAKIPTKFRNGRCKAGHAVYKRVLECEREVRVLAAKVAPLEVGALRDALLGKLKSHKEEKTVAQRHLVRHEAECAQCSGAGDD